MSELDVDHLAYVTDRHYRRRLHSTFARAGRLLGRISTLTVRHEADEICCQLEPWPVTSERIVQVLGEPVAWVFVEQHP